MYPSSTNCLLELLCQFFFTSIGRVPVYTQLLIIFERYACVANLRKNNYSVKASFIKRGISFAIILSFCMGVMSVFGALHNVTEIVQITKVSLDFLVFLIGCGVQLKSMVEARKHKKFHKNLLVLMKVEKMHTKLTFIVICTSLVFYIPYIVTSGAQTVLTKIEGHHNNLLDFSVVIGLSLVFCNSFANAIVFLTLNKKSKSLLRPITTKADTTSTQLEQ